MPFECDSPGGEVPERNMAILANQGDSVQIRAAEPARAILVAGAPLNEPIAQYGPFVMNTAEEIQQTLRAYQMGEFTRGPVQRMAG